MGIAKAKARKAIARRDVTFMDFAHECWGAENSLLALARGLAEAGHTVRLFCVSDELAQRWTSEVGPNVFLLPRPSTAGSRHRETILALRTARLVSSSSVLVIFSYHLLPGIVAARLLGLRRGPVYLDLHDVIGESRGRRIMNYFANRVDGVIAVSNFAVAELHLRRVWVLHRPVQLMESRQHGSDPPRTVGVVGRLEPVKGHRLAIEAFASADPSLHLVIRGDADPEDREYAERLRRYAQTMLGSRVTFQPKVSHDEALTGLDLVLIANSREPMGRTASEAQMQARVAIVPDAGGAAELVDHGITGLVYCADSAESLAATLDSTLAHPWQYAAIGRQSREHALAAYATRLYAAEYANVLGLKCECAGEISVIGRPPVTRAEESDESCNS